MAERLAVLGDVHANLPALEAVLAAVDGRGIASGAFTGDLVMRGPDPEGCVREVIEKVLKLNDHWELHTNIRSK